MTRGCSLATCQRASTGRCPWCKLRFCAEHELRHDCPPQQAIARAADDPTLKRRALAERAPEETLTTQVIAALQSTVPGLWRRTKRRQGNRSSDDADGVLDIEGIAAPDGIHCEVETKNDHRDGCACRPCASQRDRAEQVRGAGGVAVLGVRDVQAAVDGVRMELARKRGGERSTG